MSGRALFLDRDGVINEEAGYLHRIEQVRFMEGIFPLCRTAAALGYRLIVVTNQAGIGRGLYTAAQFETLMAWMRERFRTEGVPLDAVFHCPFHPVHGLGEYKQEHMDRKPSPGMLWRGAAEFDLDLRQSVMVGDRCTDVLAANAAGLRQAFLIRGTEELEAEQRETRQRELLQPEVGKSGTELPAAGQAGEPRPPGCAGDFLAVDRLDEVENWLIRNS